MDPYHEQRMREEVFYLHSLWHQGPSGNPNPNHIRNAPSHLRPSNPTNFKRQTNQTSFRTGPKKGRRKPPQSDPPRVLEVEWPSKETAEASLSSSAWGLATWLTPPPNTATRVPTAEEQARLAATQAQKNALKVTQEFFATNMDSDLDEDGDNDEDDLMDEDGSVEYKFFSRVFAEDGELRGYYEKNRAGGEFCCLVCIGIGKKVGKRFKDGVALVQHSIDTVKWKKLAHNAYAQVICKVLGWDIKRLPAVASSLTEAKPVDSQCTTEVCTGNSSVLNKDSGLETVNGGALILKEVSDVGQEIELHNSSANVMLCEKTLMVSDANKCTEIIDHGVVSMVNGNTEGVVNGLGLERDSPFLDGGLWDFRLQEGNKDDGVGNEIKGNQQHAVVVNDLKENNGNPN